MKSTRLIALMLAILTASSLFACNSGDTEGDNTTPAATTTADNTPAATTTPSDVSDAPETPDTSETPDEPVTPETPVRIADLAPLLAKGGDLRDLVTDTAVSESMTPWGDGSAANLFDGNTTGTKLGGDVKGSDDAIGEVDITFKTSVATTVKAYVLYTGNDSASYIGRTPTAWEFLGSNDGENWTIIDKVGASAMEDLNFQPFGYYVDEPAAYTFYKLHVTDHTPEAEDDADGHNNYLLQLNEMILVGDAAGEAETPVTDAAELDAMKAAGTDLAANVVVDSLKVSDSMTPWNDGPAANLFDGDTTTTKCGGDVIDTAYITWETDVKTTVNSYILYTGNDSGSWPGRTPTSWVLYGSTNGVIWNVIDRVAVSGMEDQNATPYGYTVDAPAAYNKYKLHVTGTTVTEDPQPDTDVTTLLQLNELVLIGSAEAAAE